MLPSSKLYCHENYFETYPNGSTFVDLVIMNVTVQTELKIDA
jgi:hypothetical protein